MFNYFSLAGIAEESCDFIFRHIIRMRSRFKLDKKRRLTYCRAREVLLDRLTDMVMIRNCSDCIVLDLAVLRRQRVMLLFVTLIMKHGRWVTEKSKNLYIHENLC